MARWEKAATDLRDLLTMNEVLLKQREELRRLNLRIFGDFVQTARSFCNLVDERN